MAKPRRKRRPPPRTRRGGPLRSGPEATRAGGGCGKTGSRARAPRPACRRRARRCWRSASAPGRRSRSARSHRGPARRRVEGHEDRRAPVDGVGPELDPEHVADGVHDHLRDEMDEPVEPMWVGGLDRLHRLDHEARCRHRREQEPGGEAATGKQAAQQKPRVVGDHRDARQQRQGDGAEEGSPAVFDETDHHHRRDQDEDGIDRRRKAGEDREDRHHGEGEAQGQALRLEVAADDGNEGEEVEADEGRACAKRVIWVMALASSGVRMRSAKGSGTGAPATIQVPAAIAASKSLSMKPRGRRAGPPTARPWRARR